MYYLNQNDDFLVNNTYLIFKFDTLKKRVFSSGFRHPFARSRRASISPQTTNLMKTI